eukprot:scaffold5085_cov115-Cylindrotheca_fusiformis.AAC.9
MYSSFVDGNQQILLSPSQLLAESNCQSLHASYVVTFTPFAKVVVVGHKATFTGRVQLGQNSNPLYT